MSLELPEAAAISLVEDSSHNSLIPSFSLKRLLSTLHTGWTNWIFD